MVDPTIDVKKAEELLTAFCAEVDKSKKVYQPVKEQIKNILLSAREMPLPTQPKSDCVQQTDSDEYGDEGVREGSTDYTSTFAAYDDQQI